MSKLRTASICLTDIKEALEKGHSAFSKGKENGKLYVQVAIWDKDEKDQFGYELSVVLNSTKEKKEEENNEYWKKKKYIGNGWIPQLGTGEKEEIQDVKKVADDLPF